MNEWMPVGYEHEWTSYNPDERFKITFCSDFAQFAAKTKKKRVVFFVQGDPRESALLEEVIPEEFIRDNKVAYFYGYELSVRDRNSITTDTRYIIISMTRKHPPMREIGEKDGLALITETISRLRGWGIERTCDVNYFWCIPPSRSGGEHCIWLVPGKENKIKTRIIVASNIVVDSISARVYLNGVFLLEIINTKLLSRIFSNTVGETKKIVPGRVARLLENGIIAKEMVPVHTRLFFIQLTIEFTDWEIGKFLLSRISTELAFHYARGVTLSVFATSGSTARKIINRIGFADVTFLGDYLKHYHNRSPKIANTIICIEEINDITDFSKIYDIVQDKALSYIREMQEREPKVITKCVGKWVAQHEGGEEEYFKYLIREYFSQIDTIVIYKEDVSYILRRKKTELIEPIN